MPEQNTEERDRGLHRHGDPDPTNWDEQKAVTDRPNDTPLRDPEPMAVPNSTLASRARERRASGSKVVDRADAENKAVTSASAKTATRKK